MTISVLCESPRDRHPQEKCASKCVRGIVLSAFIYFLAQMDLGFEISPFKDLKFAIHNACVAEQQKHLTVNQADLVVLRGCESYHMHQKFLGRRLTGKPSDSKPEILGSNPGVPANSNQERTFRKGSLTGKAVVSKTTAHLSLAGSSPVPSAKSLPIASSRFSIGANQNKLIEL